MQPDELTPLERHLAACRPSAMGLDADAMLFAAGRAAARPNAMRLIWPALAGGFAVLATILGGGMIRERAERLALADRLTRPVSGETPVPTAIPSPPTPGPDSYLAARRLVEGDDAWPVHTDGGPPSMDPAATPPAIHAWPGVSAELPP
jgi:hypothetical protein